MPIAVDLNLQSDRVKLVKAILAEDNVERKAVSLKDVEIYNGRIHQHVYDHLSKRLSDDSLLEMSIVSSINLAKRCVDQEASIYKNEPERTCPELSDEQMEKVKLIYKDMHANSKLMASNRSYKLQNQNHVMVIPKDGKLIMRSLRNHHIDKIDDTEDPEKAAGYVISSFDKETMLQNRRNETGGGSGGSSDLLLGRTERDPERTNSVIGGSADFKIGLGVFTVWTEDFNFTMNEQGEIISGDDISNPIGMIPIIDISEEKDFEYWVRRSSAKVEFTVEYNSFLSDAMQINSLQGHAQAYLIARDDIIPQNFRVGPNILLKLPFEEGSDSRPEFGYANPNPDMAGTMEMGRTLLANFLSSQGQDTSLVTSAMNASTFSSGVERLLAMMDKFEASKADMDMYERVEDKVFKIVSAWHNLAIGRPELLDPRYISATFPQDAQVFVKFSGPEMIQSEAEQIEGWTSKIEQGLASRVDAIMALEGIDDREMAKKRVAEIDQESILVNTPIETDLDKIKEELDANIGNENDQDDLSGLGGSESGTEDPS